MKKVIHKGSLNEIKTRHGDNGLIVAIRTGKSLIVQNLEAAGGEVAWDGEDLIIRYKLSDGECLVMQDETGIAEKRSL